MRPFAPAFLAAILAPLTLLAAAPSRSQVPEGTAGPPPVALPPSRAWTGKWLWIKGDPSPKNSYVYFRKTLELRGTPKQPKLHLTADSRYQLWVNGEPLGRGPARSDRRWLSYDTYELDGKLKKGKNTLAVLVHHLGESTFQYMQGRGGLIADVVEKEGKDGEKVLAGTDATWKAQRSEAWSSGQPRMSLQLGFNEVFDARKEPAGWTGAAFQDSGWSAAEEIGPAGMEPWPHLVPRGIPFMAETLNFDGRLLETAEVTPPDVAGMVPDPSIKHLSQEMAAGIRGPLRSCVVDRAETLFVPSPRGVGVRTQDRQRVSFLIDWGKEVTGYPLVRIRGAKGGEILDLGYGEVLQLPNGSVVPQAGEPPLAVTPGGAAAPLGEVPVEKGPDGMLAYARLYPDRDGVHYADRYVCKPGVQSLQTFEKRAGRYWQLDIQNAPEGLEIDGVGMLFSTYPVKYRGAFDCSDERLDRIWEVGRWTAQLNMEDGYTDCPWRERGQWSGDARIEALINHYAFGDTQLIKRTLRQHAQSLDKEGLTKGVYPTDWPEGKLPTFTLIWVSQIWETYQYLGDEALVRELFPHARYSLERFFKPKVGPRGLLKDVPHWLFIDWAKVDDKGEVGSLNALYYDALRSAAAMARLLKDPSAAEYEKQAEQVKQAINKQLWDAQSHAYRDSLLPDGRLSGTFSQQTNSLCVLFDIAPKEEQGRILDFIHSPKNERQVVQVGSPYFAFYQLGALYHVGRYQQALDLTRKQWGKMLDWGATTWWETWEPKASLCHGTSGAPTFQLSAEVMGIRPLQPGFAEVEISPQWVDWTHAGASVPTVKGDVKVAWQREMKTRLSVIRVETPKEVPAVLTLPVPGEITFNRKPQLPEGVTRLAPVDGKPRFRLEKGGQLLVELKEQ